jgi:hypothetical protein
MVGRGKFVSLVLVLVVLGGFVPLFAGCLQTGAPSGPCGRCAQMTRLSAMDRIVANTPAVPMPCCTLRSKPAPSAVPNVSPSNWNSSTVQPVVVAHAVSAAPAHDVTVEGTFAPPTGDSSPAFLCQFLI